MSSRIRSGFSSRITEIAETASKAKAVS